MDVVIAKQLLDYEDVSDYEEVVEGVIEDQDRWHTYLYSVYKHTPTDTYWRINYDVGSTEYQEGSGEVYVTQVAPKTKTITVYE